MICVDDDELFTYNKSMLSSSQGGGKKKRLPYNNHPTSINKKG